MTITLTREEGYYCVICGKFLPEEDGVIVHDDVPHPDPLWEPVYRLKAKNHD